MKINVKILLKDGTYLLHKDIVTIDKDLGELQLTNNHGSRYFYEMPKFAGIKITFEEELEEYYNKIIDRTLLQFDREDIEMLKTKDFTIEELKKVFVLRDKN